MPLTTIQKKKKKKYFDFGTIKIVFQDSSKTVVKKVNLEPCSQE